MLEDLKYNKKLNNLGIASILDRTEISVQIKLKRLKKKNDNYNEPHRKQKYEANEKFIKHIQPKIILDVYAGNGNYPHDITITNDKDKKFNADYNLNADLLLHKMLYEKRKFDIVDLDPYGSAFECFDMAIQLATKGLIITFGEIGHKRWKRLDFVRNRYNIKSLEEFSVEKMIDYIVNRGFIFNKDLVVFNVFEARNISRVYFEVFPRKKITEQWETNGKVVK